MSEIKNLDLVAVTKFHSQAARSLGRSGRSCPHAIPATEPFKTRPDTPLTPASTYSLSQPTPSSVHHYTPRSISLLIAP